MINFSPQKGREQAKRRPAIVLSPKSYNEATHLALMCPITSQVKGYPFEVALPKKLKISGVILADQLKSQDWFAREAVFYDKVSISILDELMDLIKLLLF